MKQALRHVGRPSSRFCHCPAYLGELHPTPATVPEWSLLSGIFNILEGFNPYQWFLSLPSLCLSLSPLSPTPQFSGHLLNDINKIPKVGSKTKWYHQPGLLTPRNSQIVLKPSAEFLIIRNVYFIFVILRLSQIITELIKI